MSYKLNKAQSEAVKYIDGPLLIVAGAGTGKTTVITQKIAELIKSGKAKPEEILALTFTEKAAQEMIDRVDGMLDVGYVDIQISTFHAFCQKILEFYGLDIGISGGFKLLDETGAWLLLNEHINELDLDYYKPLGNPTKHLQSFLKHFSKCKDELISPKEYLQYAEGVKADSGDANVDDKSRLMEIAGLYHQYNQLLLDNSALDFGDLIFYTIKLLEERRHILSKLQEQYKFILVDEFQDVNWAQYSLVKILAQKSHLTVVGDDDQSIYAFRGASVSNILRFKDDYKGSKEIVLNNNYRSDQKILDLAYKLIQNNNPDRLEEKLKIDKKLKSFAQTEEKNAVDFSWLSDEIGEVDRVVDTIVKIKSQTNCTWDDIAILVRANSHAEPFINTLERTGIPYEFIGSVGLFRQPIILDIINFFLAIDDRFLDSAFYRLLKMPVIKLSINDLHTLTLSAKKKSISYYEALKKASLLNLSPEGVVECNRLLDLIHSGMKSSAYDKPKTVLLDFLENSGYLTYLTEESEKGDRDIIRHIYHLQQFFEGVDKYEQTIPGANVHGFVKFYHSQMESGNEGRIYNPSDTPDSVNVLTIHASKGLEFKYVFLVNLVEDRFPSRRRKEGIELPDELVKETLPEGDFHIAEERRLFYVAITRAKEQLFLSGAGDYGGKRAKKISRFLVELGFEQVGEVDTKKSLAIESRATTLDSNQESGDFVYEIPSAFSFSQIGQYQICPYKYKLGSVLKIPTRGNPYFSFGQSIHSTLQEFYLRVQQLNGSKQSSLFSLTENDESQTSISQSNIKVPTLNELLHIYEMKWIDNWYDSKKQRESYFKNGEDLLKLFYEENEGNWTIPVGLETPFSVKIGGFLIRGRIDRIDKLPEGKLEIVDYKTGQSKEKLSLDDKQQLLLYHLAVNTLPEINCHGKVGKLTFYYVNDGKRLSFVGTDKDFEELEIKVVEAIEQIKARNFKAKPNKYICGRCDYRDICKYRKI